MNYYSTPPRSDELWHYGIKGMRWGVRRYENKDGSLTELGKRRYKAYKDHMRYRDQMNNEAQKLIDQDKSLRRIFKNGKDAAHEDLFGDDYEHRDFKTEARKRGLDTSKYEKAVKTYETHHSKNYGDIDGGMRYANIKNMTDDEYKKWRNDKIKSGLKTTAKVSAVAAALYGRHKFKKWMNDDYDRLITDLKKKRK